MMYVPLNACAVEEGQENLPLQQSGVEKHNVSLQKKKKKKKQKTKEKKKRKKKVLCHVRGSVVCLCRGRSVAAEFRRRRQRRKRRYGSFTMPEE